MAARAPQASVTSLARYAVAKQPGVDLFNGKSSRDYCNSFWGVGDAGPNLMFARMRGASKTTDELKNFWNERCAVDKLVNIDDFSDCTRSTAGASSRRNMLPNWRSWLRFPLEGTR